MINLSLDMKARLKNKTWWITIIGTIILLAKQFGFDLSQYIPNNYADIINVIFVVLAMVGITVDTSTNGISDKVVATVTENAIQAENNVKEVQVDASTTAINNNISENSARSNITVDNPDNIQAIGAIVNVTSATSPQ